MSKPRPAARNAAAERASKWDPASRAINDVRTMFTANDTLFHRYGMGEHYTSVGAVVDAATEQQLPENMRSYLLLVFRDWAPLAFWNRHKQVYTMHPTLTRELRATAVDDKIPGAVLRQLPHPDPVFVFPEGVPVQFDDKERGRLFAVSISGAKISAPGHANYASTLDPEANGLYFNALTHVLGKDGGIVDIDFCHTSIPFTDGTFTIGAEIHASRPQYTFDHDGISEGFADKTMLAYVQQVVGIGLAHLLYAVSGGADIAPPRNTTTAQNPSLHGDAHRHRPIKHQPVGYVVGPALDRARREQQQQERTPGTGASKRPHLRKAHFHTVRFGPGRSDARVDWFPPIPVNQDGTPAAKPTIHGY